MYADANRTITKVNPAFCDAFGYNESEVIGQSVRIIYSDSADFEEQGEIRFNPHTPADPASYAMNYRRADGSVFESETVATQVRDVLDEPGD
ncbi:MAG: hypothetical protein MAG453_00788 [Calditrichaeota bacterium]|nr:hypothetical protein [Calditrichota bacterium]